MDGQTDGWMVGWMDGQTDGRTPALLRAGFEQPEPGCEMSTPGSAKALPQGTSAHSGGRKETHSGSSCLPWSVLLRRHLKARAPKPGGGSPARGAPAGSQPAV